MNGNNHRSYKFASFRVDAAERQLWRGQERIVLTAKVFDVLLALVENAGRTVEKGELMERVWADTFVEEGNLNRNISTLRKVLGDDSRRQKFIKTVPKQGYRFTADVYESTGDEAEMVIENRTTYRLRMSEETRESVFPQMLAVKWLAPAALVLLAGAVWIVISSIGTGTDTRVASAATSAPDTEAEELYKIGRALWKTRDGDDLYQATVTLEKAVAKSPNFALARAALADAYAFDFRNWRKAEAEAREAIRLDPELGQAHATIGFVRLFWEWNIAGAETELAEAVRLSPEYATARQWYALALFANGTAGHAGIAEMRAAHELDPTSVAINADLCQALYLRRMYDEAAAQCLKTLEIDPTSQNAYAYLYDIYSDSGKSQAAVNAYFDLRKLDAARSPGSHDLQELQRAFDRGGINAFWAGRIDHILRGKPLHYQLAKHYARLADKDSAFDHLTRAFELNDVGFYLVLAEPVFERLHGDPRFDRLRARFLGTD